MILEELIQHYDRLADDPESDVAPLGFRRQGVSTCVVLDEDASMFALQDIRIVEGSRVRTQRLVLPYLKTRTSGDFANFLWDTTGYVLGRDSKTTAKKLAKRHHLFLELHQEFAEKTKHPDLLLLCRFLENWNPDAYDTLPDADELLGSFVVFKRRGDAKYLHDDPLLQEEWTKFIASELKTRSGTSLLDNQQGLIVSAHPMIQGVNGANTSGAALISFNKDKTAFTSHGKDGNYNAPLTLDQAFKYATALNHLLADRKHRIQLGDTTCVFWTDRPDTGAANALAEAMDNFWLSNQPTADTQEKEAGAALGDFLNRFRQAQAAPAAADLEAAAAPFYVLGLSPNAARISVRFWLQCSVAELASRLSRHVFRTAVFDSRRQSVVQPTLRELLRETGRETKDIPPQLAGDMARTILLGSPYPDAFAVSLLRRVVADANINSPRAAGLKAWLIRNHEMEVPVSLDPDRTDAAYLLGRLFATYEKVQQESVDGKLNRTIRDSYLSSASATPAGIFPRLYRLNQHHFNKLRREKPGLAVVREKLIGEICNPLTDFPRHLKLQDQGLFAIGYYHQTQDFYTKRDTPDATPNLNTDSTHPQPPSEDD